MKHASPLIAIITLNWNGLDHLKYFLPTATKQDYPNYVTIIVDNASSDNSVEYVKHNYRDAILLESKKNLGYSRGFNLGIKKAISINAEYLLITNNDVELDESILTSSLELFSQMKDIGYMSGKIFDLKKRDMFQRAGGRKQLTGLNRGAFEFDKGQYEKIEFFDYIDDVCGIVPTEVIKTVGPYDNDFFYDFEEAEWHLRMKRNGYKLIYNPKMVAWHAEHGRTKGTHSSPIPQFHHWRSKILFYYKTKSPNYFLCFIIPFLFCEIPLHWFTLLKKSNPRLIYYNFKGLISGLKYIINN